VLASGEECGQTLPRLRSEACFAEPDCVKAERKCTIADQVLGWNRRFGQDGSGGWPPAGSCCRRPHGASRGVPAGRAQNCDTPREVREHRLAGPHPTAANTTRSSLMRHVSRSRGRGGRSGNSDLTARTNARRRATARGLGSHVKHRDRISRRRAPSDGGQSTCRRSPRPLPTPHRREWRTHGLHPRTPDSPRGHFSAC